MEKKSGTYSKLYVQIVFAVKYRESLLNPSWEHDLYKYITGIVKQKNQLMISINGHRDHIHMLLAVKPTCVISDLVREVKKSSTEYIKENRLVRGTFNWQVGFGVFSYSRWDVPMIVNYIENQKAHHSRVSFRDEYKKLLTDFEVEHKEEYLFDWLDEAA